MVDARDSSILGGMITFIIVCRVRFKKSHGVSSK